MTIQEKLGKVVKLLRNANGVSQEKMAFYAKIDTRYISNIESGQRNVSIDILERLAQYFDLTLSDFMALVENYGEEGKIDQLKKYLVDEGFDESTFFTNPDYSSAILGVTENGNVVYSHKRMVDYLVVNENMNPEEAIEFVDYNSVRTVPYMGEQGPVIFEEIPY